MDRRDPSNSVPKKTESVPSPALRTTRSVQPSPFEVGRDDLRRQAAGGERADPDEAAVAVGIERDRVVAGVDAGEHGALIGVRDPGDVARGESGVDRDGGIEGAGLPGDALAIEDVPGPVDHQDIVGAVAVDVGHQGRGMRGGGELAGVGERAVAVAQQHRELCRGHPHYVSGTARSSRPSPLKSPATDDLSIPAAYVTRGWKVPSPLPSSTNHPAWVGPRGEGLLIAVIGHGQVEPAVTVEVTRHRASDSLRLPPRPSSGAGTCRRRCPSAPTQRTLELRRCRCCRS